MSSMDDGANHMTFFVHLRIRILPPSTCLP